MTNAGQHLLMDTEAAHIPGLRAQVERIEQEAVAAKLAALLPVERLAAALADYHACRCDPIWTGRDLHAPECIFDEVEWEAEAILAALTSEEAAP